LVAAGAVGLLGVSNVLVVSCLPSISVSFLSLGNLVLTLGIGGGLTWLHRWEVQREAQFTETRRLLEVAVTHLDEAFAITDREGCLLYVNPLMENLSGYSAEEMLRKNLRVLKSGCQSEEYYRDLWETILAGRSWSGRFCNKRKDGSLWTEAATISPVEDKRGEITHFIKVARVIDQELAVEEGLRRHQKLEAMGTLSGGIAHEFNNVLGMILGYAELVRDELPSDSPAWKDLGKVLEATDRGARLVQQILTFSRQAEGDAQPLVVQAVVKETLKMMRASLPSRVEIFEEIHAPGIEVLLDPVQLRQLVVSLVTNASQALGEGKGSIHIRLQEVPDAQGKHRLQLEVEDDGCGIAEQHLSRVFDPFFTTRSQAEGGGLGLSVVHGIVDACSGTVEIETEVDRGTQVRVNFPIHQAEAVHEDQEEQDRFCGHVLLVDDEALLVEAVSRTLESLELKVSHTSDSRLALERVCEEAESFDVLFTDLTMPHVGGLELARVYKEKHPQGRVILHTGYGGDTVLQRGAGEGVVDRVLYKPLQRAALIECLQEVFPS
jgi:PAS domain S-box-containing protein